MKQTRKSSAATAVHTNIRLDGLSKARLDWIKAFYAKHGENLSTSIVLRRAIEVLETQLAQYCSGKFKRELEGDIVFTLSFCINRPDPFNSQYPWKNLGDSPLKTFANYTPSPLMDSLWADRTPLRSSKPINN
jgi:hypothetical protein